jgi:hypothetical protein
MVVMKILYAVLLGTLMSVITNSSAVAAPEMGRTICDGKSTEDVGAMAVFCVSNQPGSRSAADAAVIKAMGDYLLRNADTPKLAYKIMSSSQSGGTPITVVMHLRGVYSPDDFQDGIAPNQVTKCFALFMAYVVGKEFRLADIVSDMNVSSKGLAPWVGDYLVSHMRGSGPEAEAAARRDARYSYGQGLACQRTNGQYALIRPGNVDGKQEWVYLTDYTPGTDWDGKGIEFREILNWRYTGPITKGTPVNEYDARLQPTPADASSSAAGNVAAVLPRTVDELRTFITGKQMAIGSGVSIAFDQGGSYRAFKDGVQSETGRWDVDQREGGMALLVETPAGRKLWGPELLPQVLKALQ